MSFLGSIGFLMKDSGLSQLWETVYAPASVPHMLSGHAYAKVTFWALSTIIIEEFKITEENKRHVENIFSNFSEKSPSFSVLEKGQVVGTLKIQLLDAIGGIKQRGNPSQLWIQYCEFNELAFHFIQAERMGNCKLHLKCVRAMLPIFHAAGHFPLVSYTHLLQ